MNKENYNLFKYWIEEREAIRVKKESGVQQPWTKDEILQKYRFTNVNRLNDRQNKEAHKHIKYLIDADRIKDVHTVVYFATRCSIEGLNKLAEYDYNAEQFLQHSVDTGNKYRLGAYIVNYTHMVKDYVNLNLLNIERLVNGEYEDLQNYGAFMLNQVAVYYQEIKQLYGLDLTKHGFINYYSFSKVAGTGKGLGYLELPLAVESVISLKEQIEKDLPHIKLNNLNDISNCLCEFSKYYEFYIGKKRRVRNYVRTEEN